MSFAVGGRADDDGQGNGIGVGSGWTFGLGGGGRGSDFSMGNGRVPWVVCAGVNCSDLVDHDPAVAGANGIDRKTGGQLRNKEGVTFGGIDGKKGGSVGYNGAAVAIGIDEKKGGKVVVDIADASKGEYVLVRLYSMFEFIGWDVGGWTHIPIRMLRLKEFAP